MNDPMKLVQVLTHRVSLADYVAIELSDTGQKIFDRWAKLRGMNPADYKRSDHYEFSWSDFFECFSPGIVEADWLMIKVRMPLE